MLIAKGINWCLPGMERSLIRLPYQMRSEHSEHTNFEERKIYLSNHFANQILKFGRDLSILLVSGYGVVQCWKNSSLKHLAFPKGFTSTIYMIYQFVVNIWLRRDPHKLAEQVVYHLQRRNYPLAIAAMRQGADLSTPIMIQPPHYFPYQKAVYKPAIHLVAEFMDETMQNYLYQIGYQERDFNREAFAQNQSLILNPQQSGSPAV